jgi:oxalate decarboxylase
MPREVVAQNPGLSIAELAPLPNREANADEWKYYISSTAEMGVILAQGNAVIDQFEAGDVGNAPVGAGHYIKNTGSDLCRILVGFNSPWPTRRRALSNERRAG